MLSRRSLLCGTLLLASALLSAPPARGQGPTGLEAFEKDLQKAAAFARPRVVSITSYEAREGGEEPGEEPGEPRGRGPGRGRKGPFRGPHPFPRYRFSGILFSAEGHVVTVADAVEDKARVSVTLLDGRSFDARLVGLDRLTNVGVLKIDARDLPFVSEDRSAGLSVGSVVLAVGNPFGLRHSVSMGIVSGLDRRIRGRRSLFHGMIQTTAPINPGDAGGCLADRRGRFVGMISSTFGRSPSFGRVRVLLSTWVNEFARNPELVRKLVDYVIQSRLRQGGGEDEDPAARAFEKEVRAFFEKLGRDFGFHRHRGRKGRRHDRDEADGMADREASFGAQGINFVMPGDRVLAVAREIVARGRVVRGYLGAGGRSAASLDDQERERLGLGPGRNGVLIERVTEGSPAATAGLRPGDVLLSFGGRPLEGLMDLFERVLASRPGDRVELVLLRDRSEIRLTVEVAERQADESRDR